MLKKALLYKEYLRNKGIAGVFIFSIFMYYNFPLFQYVLDKLDPRFRMGTHFLPEDPFGAFLPGESIFNLPFFTLAITLLVMFLFHDMRNDSCQFALNLPFSKKEIIINKMFTGTMIINISLIATFIGAGLIFFVAEQIGVDFLNYSYNPYMVLFKWLVIELLVYNAILTLEFLLLSLFSNIYVSGFLSLILLYLSLPIGSIISHTFNLGNIFGNTFFSMSFITFGQSIGHISYGNFTNGSSYPNFMSHSLLLLGMILLFSFTSIYLFSKNKFEYNGNTIMFKWSIPLFKIMFAILIGYILTRFTSYWTDGVLYLLFFVLFSLLSYFIAHKVIEITSE